MRRCPDPDKTMPVYSLVLGQGFVVAGNEYVRIAAGSMVSIVPEIRPMSVQPFGRDGFIPALKLDSCEVTLFDANHQVVVRDFYYGAEERES